MDLTRGARRALLTLVLVASLLVSVAAAHAVRPTSAAWENAAYARATVSTSSTWTVNKCEVRNGDGTLSALACTVLAVKQLNYWGSSGSGQGNLSIDLYAPGITNTQYVAFTLTIPTSGAPSWWSWANAAITGTNNGITISSRCAQLPQFSGAFPANKGDTVNVYVSFADNRSATPLCVTP